MLCYTKDKLEDVKGTVLFLGDSITDIGQYISFLNCWRLLAGREELAFINAGVSSETCSGLSEPKHPFPRPCVQSRVTAALEIIKPDWVVISYGVNDGIYYPFSEERFAAFQKGIQDVLDKVHASGAKTVLLTPLSFDAFSFSGVLGGEEEADYSFMKPYRDYDYVLRRYAGWITEKGEEIADKVIDLRTPFFAEIVRRRETDDQYCSGDGIHPNLHGHCVMAATILKELFCVETTALESILAQDDWRLFHSVYERDQLEHGYWKEYIGHENPNKTDLPVNWRKRAADLDAEIAARLREKQFVHRFRWEGFTAEEFFAESGYEVIAAEPESPAEGRPWVWRTEFFGAFPSADIELLRRGWHVIQLKIPDLYGAPDAVELMEDFFAEIIKRYELTQKAVLFGFSRGGLYAVNYTVCHPHHVRLLYLDAPVTDMESWPGGKYGGVGAAEEYRQCRLAYGADYCEAVRKQKVLDELLISRIPLILVAGDSDEVVPYSENGAFLQAGYEKTDVPFQCIIKQGIGHHPHSLDNPGEIVKFILEH